MRNLYWSRCIGHAVLIALSFMFSIKVFHFSQRNRNFHEVLRTLKRGECVGVEITVGYSDERMIPFSVCAI